MASFRSIISDVYDREERKQQYQSYIRGLNARERHKKFVNDYVSYYGKEKPIEVKLPTKTDQDALREGYRFIRTEEDDLDTSWEQRLVKRYYDKLFKEYCIADMSKYKSGKIGLRWRTEKEVISSKGQFVCGNKHCDEKDDLASYEVNFVYYEAGESKQALVKLVACKSCAEKLHYRRRKEKEQLERMEKEERDRKRLKEGSSSDDYETDEEYTTDNSKQRKDRKLMEDGRRDEHGGSRERKERKRRRDYSSISESKDESPPEKRESHRKGKEKGSRSPAANNKEDEENETFKEFMEGMFP